MSFPEAIKSFFVKWIDFKSRSSRSEFWWPTLVMVLLNVGHERYAAGYLQDAPSWVTAPVSVALLFLLVASVMLAIRRLHDIDRSGWWWLIVFTLVGIIPLLYWFCTEGGAEENRFGRNPLSKTSGQTNDDPV